MYLFKKILSCPILYQSNKHVNLMRHFSSITEQFAEAQKKLNTLKEDPDNAVKLKLYALYKQASLGPVSTKRPGALDFVGRAKWDAWNSLQSMGQEDAQRTYIEVVSSLVTEQGMEMEDPKKVDLKTDAQNFLVTCKNGVRKISLNRPNKKNAYTMEMYSELSEHLNDAATDSNTVIVVLTGEGDYYSSGNDLNNFVGAAQLQQNELHAFAIAVRDHVVKFVSSFIDFPKPLIAVVNGPAVGVAVTTLGLCDIVYATDKATLHTPFSALGQSPEGCSSYLFPLLMGAAKANELLLFGKKITAQEAYERNLFTEIFPHDVFHQTVYPRIEEYAKLPENSLIYSKKLTRYTNKEILHKVNIAECDRLLERWMSKDCIDAIANFFQKKK